ncbi:MULTISPECIES: S26 family signal peptidase [Halomonas]|uniref:S26 family signal peptidase n=1 Tax=Halomonas TaxID=2745 RepID=UPI001868A36C|nr:MULTISPECIES: S26 family signal peptidase [Halomonas]
MLRMPCWIATRRRFLVKAGVSLAIIVGGGTYVAERFTFGADPAQHRCLADYRTFVVDHHRHDIERNQLVAFHAEGIEPFFPDGTLIAKYVRGVPGDTVAITPSHDVMVNGEVIETGLPYAEQAGLDPDDLVGQRTLNEGEYWVMGDTDYAFDSRYWGTIRHDQISGKANGLF